MPSNYSLDDMTNDILLSINYLKLNDIYLFGASQGGMIAINMGIKNPNLVKKIAICSSIIKASNESNNLFGPSLPRKE